MSYTKITDYASKDNLLTSNPAKLVRGSELGAEFDALVVAEALNLKSATAASTYALQGANSDITSLSALTSINASMISGYTADATPDQNADYVWTYDASASGNKKVLLGNLNFGLSYMREFIGYPGSSTIWWMQATDITLFNPSSLTTVTLRAPGAITSSNLAAAQGGSAANGRDQSATFTANTWIYMYFIWGSGQAFACLASASRTAPTLPANYTHWALAAAVPWGAGVWAWNMRYNGNKCSFDEAVVLGTGLSATTETSLSLSSVVPPGAGAVTGYVTGTATADASANLGINIYIRGITGVNPYVFNSLSKGYSGGAGGSPTFVGQSFELHNSGTLYYQHAIGMGSLPLTAIYINGFFFPNGAI